MKIYFIILFPLLGALINGLIALSASMRQSTANRMIVNLFGVGLPLAAFVIALQLGLPFIKGAKLPLVEHLFSWIVVGDFRIEAALLLDRLSVVMSLIVTGVGSLIHLYSTGYMKEDPGYAKYFCFLNLFLASMLILILGDSLLTMFLGWEGVGLCSYLLIGFWFEDTEKAKAGKKAFVVNRIGDFGFLLGIFTVAALLLPLAKGYESTLSFAFMQENISALGGFAVLITFFFFIGAMGKSAQIPLYVWLPDAMAGPTPVSALIHAATMVTAGIYMIARLHFLFDLAPATLNFVATIGCATAFFAATIALVQNDIKKVLAYSTVSQLGYMFLAMGVGAYAAGVFHLMTHAFFKACLFLGSGSVIHAMGGEQDIRKMGGLRKAMPVTAMTFLIATIAIAGIPPLAGFFSKDEILWETFYRGNQTLWILGSITAFMTSFYMFRLTFLTFFGKSRVSTKAKSHLHESPWTMTVPLILLALLSIGGGWVGIPHVLGLPIHNYWHEFMQVWVNSSGPLSEAAHHQEMMLMGLSVGIAMFGLLLAAILYLKFPEVPSRFAKGLGAFYRMLKNKYYVDEIYDALIVNPIQWISENVFAKVMDEKMIDGSLVNGSGRLMSFGGSLVSRLQSGRVNAYAFYFLLGIVAFILGWVLW